MARILGIGGELPEVVISAPRIKKTGIGDYIPIIIGAGLGVGSFYVDGSIKWALRAAAATPFIFTAMSKKNEPNSDAPQVQEASAAAQSSIIPLPVNGWKYTAAVKAQNTELWNSMIIKPEKIAEIDWVVKKIMKHKQRYELATMPFSVPWYVIAIKHWLEGGGNFTKHVHNGDPLTDRTVNVPKNPRRPIAPPLNGKTYTWEESAIDAIIYTEMHKRTDWSIPSMLWIAEAYNGGGYRNMKKLSAYLWSFSNHYTIGKYGTDGNYDPNLVSKQAGFAVVLKRLIQKGYINPPMA